jgi:hypothetical protein
LKVMASRACSSGPGANFSDTVEKLQKQRV